MKVTATSQFHGNSISANFNLQEGINIRKITKKHNPCTGDHGTCGCGWPYARTSWELPEGYAMRFNPVEVGPCGAEYGRGYIMINLVKV